MIPTANQLILTKILKLTRTMANFHLFRPAKKPNSPTMSTKAPKPIRTYARLERYLSELSMEIRLCSVLLFGSAITHMPTPRTPIPDS